MKTIHEMKLADLVPENLMKDEKVVNAASSIDPQLRILIEQKDLPSIYRHIDLLTSTQLDHLAVCWNASTWRDYWPIGMKRSIIKNVILSNRRRGTVQAVKEALASVSSAAEIVEWWQTEPKGNPHTFTIYATQSKIAGVIDAELQKDMMAMVNDAKPLRSHFELIVQETFSGGVNACGFVRRGVYARVR